MAEPAPASTSTYSNITVPIPTSTPLTSQQVSWQSAFLGLAPIALNTCLQESSLVLDIDANYVVPWRSSPFVCLFDSTLVWLRVAYWTRKYGITKATKIVQQLRKPEIANSRVAIQSFFVMLLLVALAVVQATKLFGFRGIPWTQAFAAAFLLNYFTNLGLGYFGRHSGYQSLGDNEREEFRGHKSWPSSRIVDTFVFVAILFQVGTWLFACERVWSAVQNIDHGTAGFWLATVVGYLPAIFLVTTVLQAFGFIFIAVEVMILLLPIAVALGFIYVSWRFLQALIHRIARYINWNAKRMGYSIGISLAVSMAFIWVRFVGFAPYRKVLDAAAAFSMIMSGYDAVGATLNWLFAPCILLGLFGWYTAVSYALVAFFASTWHDSFLEAKTQGDRYLWFVLLANFALAFLYFRYAYKQGGTFKPSWTENLG